MTATRNAITEPATRKTAAGRDQCQRRQTALTTGSIASANTTPIATVQSMAVADSIRPMMAAASSRPPTMYTNESGCSTSGCAGAGRSSGSDQPRPTSSGRKGSGWTGSGPTTCLGADPLESADPSDSADPSGRADLSGAAGPPGLADPSEAAGRPGAVTPERSAANSSPAPGGSVGITGLP